MPVDIDERVRRAVAETADRTARRVFLEFEMGKAAKEVQKNPETSQCAALLLATHTLARFAMLDRAQTMLSLLEYPVDVLCTSTNNAWTEIEHLEERLYKALKAYVFLRVAPERDALAKAQEALDSAPRGASSAVLNRRERAVTAAQHALELAEESAKAVFYKAVET